tara:strand:- start:19278 stop:20246 length:969 start_codon:yes stop_codon:yes gene_type:complete
MSELKEKRVGKDYKIPFALIDADENENPRTDYGDINPIVNTIMERGIEFIEAIKVIPYKADDGTMRYKLSHGFRRNRAFNKAKKKGFDLQYVMATKLNKNYSERDRLLDHLTSNAGKSLNPMEQMNAVDMLKKTGLNNSEIARQIGFQPTRIGEFVLLAKLSDAVKGFINDDYISSTLVLKVVKANNSDIVKAEQIITENVNAMLDRATEMETVVETGDNEIKEEVIEEKPVLKVTEKNIKGLPRMSKNVKVYSKIMEYATKKDYDKSTKDKIEFAGTLIEVFDSAKGKDSPEELLCRVMDVLEGVTIPEYDDNEEAILEEA